MVAFTTRHMFGTAAVKGSFDLRARELTVAEPITASHVAATAAADSFATATPKRDKHVRSVDFLHADTHPDISFRSTGLVHDGASWILHGTITARGNTAPVELTLTRATTDPTGLTVRATGKLPLCPQDRQAERHGRPLPAPDHRCPRRARLTTDDGRPNWGPGQRRDCDDDQNGGDS